ncbi:O-antigen ligase family protein [Tichowtungia aerotolerans]|uniref:O-antigen ligase-related domain-containing protein n=1 Tax=Tichowtungia aerotolerans TaxID=2697043 RepID=A0A6P1M6J6_9BACT|nr:O-antigen ligase [Tichowtungia aerotolerans]QHI70200.1 hypothetical protein GT409_12370 [Tichowtungia aerotolerans]
MKLIDKITVILILLVLITGFSIYGVWEDKMMFLSLLIPVVYIALAMWVVAAGWRAANGRGRTSEIPCRKTEGREQRSDDKIQRTEDRGAGRPHSFVLRPSAAGMMIPPGGIMLFLFWSYSALMIPFSVIPYEAKISTLRLGCYVGTYWVVANICSRFSRRKVVWVTLLLALLGVALYSLVQHKINFDMLFGSERYADYGGRLGGTYICPNHIAHLFQMWMPFCFIFLFVPQLGWFGRICFGYAIPVFGLLIYQTQSRAGLLGAVVSVGMLFLLLMLRKSRKAFAIALVAAPLLVVSGIGGLWAGSSMFRERMEPVFQVLNKAMGGNWEEVASLDFRPMTWADAGLMIAQDPITGYGPGNYGQSFPEFRMRWRATRRETVHPHNEPLELLAEYGIVGALLFAGAVICFCISLVRVIKDSDRRSYALPAAAMLAALAGTFVHGLFDFELRIFPNALMLSVLAGCAAAPTRKEGRAGSLSRWTCVLFSAFLLLALVWSLQVMSSAGLRVRGDLLRLSGNRKQAETLYNAAVRIDPQNWQAYLGMGQVYSHYRYYELDAEKKTLLAQQERDAYARAYRHNTKKEEVVYGLGRAELACGNRDAGIDYLRQAANYRRFNDFYWRKLGIELRKAELYEEAREVFEHAYSLDRSNPTVRANLKWLKKHVAAE